VSAFALYASARYMIPYLSPRVRLQRVRLPPALPLAQAEDEKEAHLRAAVAAHCTRCREFNRESSSDTVVWCMKGRDYYM